MCGNEYSLNGTIGRDVRTRKFQHLHQRNFVRLPHHYHSLENSRTFQDLALKFPGLSKTKPIFQDFPGPGNFTPKNPGLSRSVGTLTCTVPLWRRGISRACKLPGAEALLGPRYTTCHCQLLANNVGHHYFSLFCWRTLSPDNVGLCVRGVNMSAERTLNTEIIITSCHSV